jgi:hypothetical protein
MKGFDSRVVREPLFSRSRCPMKSPWFVQGVYFDEAKRQLTIQVDFVVGSRFAHADAAGEHPVHDT